MLVRLPQERLSMIKVDIVNEVSRVADITTVVGGLHYLSFVSDFERAHISMGLGALFVRGFWYSGTLLAILGAHEMGHYAFCRKYEVDASLPYFIPAPIPLTGTLGAVIRIREAFPT